MCEPDRGVPLGGVLAVAGIVAGGLVAVRVLAAVAPFLAALGAAMVVLAVASVPVLRWARRFSVVCLPARQPQAAVARQTALPARTRLMLDAAKEVVVTPEMILQNAVKEEAR